VSGGITVSSLPAESKGGAVDFITQHDTLPQKHDGTQKDYLKIDLPFLNK
jgi:hypothetical protein